MAGWGSARGVLRCPVDDAHRPHSLRRSTTWNRYANPQAPLPVYLPDEALLIKAEALANQNNLAPAQAALDSVQNRLRGWPRNQ